MRSYAVPALLFKHRLRLIYAITGSCSLQLKLFRLIIFADNFKQHFPGVIHRFTGLGNHRLK
ncbi:hypothetical protein D3C72_2413300 [compost metagenome]